VRKKKVQEKTYSLVGAGKACFHGELQLGQKAEDCGS